MKKFLFICWLFCLVNGRAQSFNDSLAVLDSQKAIQDSLSSKHLKDSLARIAFVNDSLQQREFSLFAKMLDTSIYSYNPYYSFRNPTKLLVAEHSWQGKEAFFYAILALLLFFAFLKTAFSRYVGDLFRTFFRTSVKQNQTRDQLMGAPLPSLLFNILYAISAALFITLLLHHFNLGKQYSFWLLFAYDIACLLVIYTVKFLSLKLFGWILRIVQATDTYIFIVFTTNKIIGILLLPFIVALAFTDQEFYEVAFTLSICLLGVLFIYRFYLSYLSVYKLVQINFFHFVLYLAALEIAPFLLINKLLVRFFS